MSEDDPILPRVARGDAGAMDACVASFGGLVWSIARKHVRTDHDAEDLAQEIFTALWKNAPRYNPAVGSEVTFVGMIARRRSIDWLRSQGRRPELEPLSGEAAEMTDSGRHPGAAADGSVVMNALRSLPGDTQQLFRFHFESGMSHGEIAEETGLPLGTVKTRLRAGLLELRNLIRRLDAPGQPTATA